MLGKKFTGVSHGEVTVIISGINHAVFVTKLHL